MRRENCDEDSPTELVGTNAFDPNRNLISELRICRSNCGFSRSAKLRRIPAETLFATEVRLSILFK